MNAEATIDRSAPGQVRIVLREGTAGVATFAGFVVAIAAAIYLVMPAARAQPGTLGGIVGAALAWAAVAGGAREEYLVSQGTGLTARQVWLFGRREDQVSAEEVTAVRLARAGPDDDRRVVELVGLRKEMRLRVPRRFNTLSVTDQRAIGQLLAEHFGVPLQGE